MHIKMTQDTVETLRRQQYYSLLLFHNSQSSSTKHNRTFTVVGYVI